MSDYVPWKVVHVELADGLAPLAPDPRYQGVYLVFWWHGVPLGHAELVTGQLPLSETNLADVAVRAIARAVGHYLFRHGFEPGYPVRRAAMLGPRRPPDLTALLSTARPLLALLDHFGDDHDDRPDERISVIICTRDRATQLERCLESVARCDPAPGEVLVVDNAPGTGGTREVVAQFPEVQYVPESRPGLSVARNTGIRMSTGEIVAFTDDDAVVDRTWVGRIARAFRDERTMAVTGLVLAAELETESQRMFEKEGGGFGQGYRARVFDSSFFGQMRRWGVPVWKIGAGANMAIRRRTFELLGGFDERLGAGASGCSEDSEFWYRVLAAGWVCRYDPAVVVHHFHRRDLCDLRHQQREYMRGHVVSLLVQYQRHRDAGNLYRLLVTLPWYYLKLVREGSRPFRSRHRSLVSEVMGCAAGVFYFLRHRRDRAVPHVARAVRTPQPVPLTR